MNNKATKEEISILAQQFAKSIDFIDVDALMSTGEMLQQWHKESSCDVCVAPQQERKISFDKEENIDSNKFAKSTENTQRKSFRKSRMSVCVLPQIVSSSDDESSYDGKESSDEEVQINENVKWKRTIESSITNSCDLSTETESEGDNIENGEESVDEEVDINPRSKAKKTIQDTERTNLSLTNSTTNESHLSTDTESESENACDESLLFNRKKTVQRILSSDNDVDGSFLVGHQKQDSVSSTSNCSPERDIKSPVKTSLFPMENTVKEKNENDTSTDDDNFNNFISSQQKKKVAPVILSSDEESADDKYFIVSSSDSDDEILKTPAYPRARKILSEKRFQNLKTPKSATKTIIDNLKTSKLETCTPAYKREFNKIRDKAVADFFQLFNKTIFDGKLDPEMMITWNKRMTKTAGFCVYKSAGVDKRSCKIELSDKVIDCVERLRDTLIHELCHAATWIIDGKKVNHGPAWQYWAKKANRVHSDLPIIKRCHQYEIHTKYNYQCNSCNATFGRHSKSIDPSRHRCSNCGGIPVLLENPKTPSVQRTPNTYALFLKSNFASVKKSNPGISHKELMKIISEKFRDMKTHEKEN